MHIDAFRTVHHFLPALLFSRAFSLRAMSALILRFNSVTAYLCIAFSSALSMWISPSTLLILTL